MNEPDPLPQKMDSAFAQEAPPMPYQAPPPPPMPEQAPRPPPTADVHKPDTISPAPGTPPSLPNPKVVSDTSIPTASEKNVRFNTPPPSPPPLLRRTTGHLPERRLGSTSSIESESEISPVSPLGATSTSSKHAGTSPPTTPERERKPLLSNTPPSDRTLRRASGSISVSPTSSKGLPFSDNTVKSPEPLAKAARKKTENFPIPVSLNDPHPEHDLPIPTPVPGEEKIPLHPTPTNSSTRSFPSTFDEKPATTPGTAIPASRSNSHSHKHPEGGRPTTAGSSSYKGRLWSDWHWHRNQDLPVPPAHKPGVTDEELERKKYISPYPKPASLADKEGKDGNGTGKDWKQELEKTAGWAKEKIGEWGRKLNENMHYGGDSGRGRRHREDNVSFK